MEFEKLELSNYRCFADETVVFEPGVTVIYGRNGSGKSTILEACFFALYGSDALREGDATLEDIITNNEDTTTVTLRFRHHGDVYTVTREVRERSGRVTQAVCELDTPDGVLSGATDVDERIQQLIRMDASAFLNCAYVRQGDIEKLIHASSDERRNLIDRLLQLGRLETYKDRASDIRVGVKRVRDNRRSLREDRKEEIESYEESDPYGQLEQLDAELDSLQERLTSLKERRESLVDEKDDAENTVSSQLEYKERIAELNEDIDACETRINELQDEQESFKDQITSKREEVEETDSQLREVMESASVTIDVEDIDDPGELEAVADSLSEEKTALTESLATKTGEKQRLEDKKDRLNGELDDAMDSVKKNTEQAEVQREKLENDLRPELSSLESEVESKQERIEELQGVLTENGVEPDDLPSMRRELESKRSELVSERSSIQGDRKAAENELERAKELRAKGKCPECGQSVEESPHVDRIGELEENIAEYNDQYESVGEEITAIDERLEEVDGFEETADELREVSREKRNVEKLLEKQRDAISDVEESLGEYEDAVETARERVSELEAEVEDVEEELRAVTSEVSSVRDEKERVDAQISVVGELLSVHERRDALSSEIDDLQTRVAHNNELLQEKRNRLESLQGEHDSVSEQLDESSLEDAQARLESVEDDIEGVDDEIASVEDTIGEKQQLKGQVSNRIDRLERLRDEKKQYDAEVEVLEVLYEQMQGVEEMYSKLRGDLRQENVRKLEQLLNDVFEVMYQNDAYDRIELDGEYNATVVEKTAGELEPQKLSGGESALFNLSLRCAIYQLLVQGVGGTALMPPLILDEPTVHLDEGHVGQIDEIVRRMRDIGVEQTIVVSHNDEIIDSANHRICVEQKPASNRSFVRVEPAVRL